MNKLSKTVLGLAIAGIAQLSYADVSKQAVLNNYADIAQAGYQDSLIAAEALQLSITSFLADPSAAGLDAARKAWVNSRIPYMQTEVYRFGNAIVDDWEGKVNAWPLDEGLIDYVDTSVYGDSSDENGFYVANAIANPEFVLGGEKIDAKVIDVDLLQNILQEAEGNEANVATGYHAIEFLLWGQDLNGTGPGAGDRPFTDYDLEHCTHGNCDRRAQYLQVATQLLIDDLKWMTGQWGDNGGARQALLADEDAGIASIVTGMGSLSYGELAGERMQLGLILHDPEEEHDCFSDYTHYSHYYDVVGINNVFHGRYKRLDGSTVSGPSLSDMIAAKDPKLQKLLEERIATTILDMQQIVNSAEKGERYDQLLGEDNVVGNAMIQKAIDALVAQADVINDVIALLDLRHIEIEGSDSLDAPEKVAG